MRDELGRIVRVLTVMLLAVLATLAGTATAAADPPTIELSPESVSLAPGATATAVLVLRNPGPDPVTGTLAVGDLIGVTVAEPAAAGPVSVAPGASVGVRLPLAADRTFAGGALTVQVTGTAGSVPFVAVTTLTLTVPPLLPALGVSLIGVPADLSDGQTGTVTVQVSNPTTRYLADVRLRTLGSQSLCWRSTPGGSCESGESGDRSLGPVGPGGLLTATADLQAGDRVRPGSQQVAVVAEADVAGEPATAVVGSTQASVTLTVFGLDLFSPFGITGLLLLPGAVALLAYQVTRRVLPGPPAPGAVDIKDPGALLFIVPVGLLVYLLALSVLRLNLRDEVGTADAIWLFVTGVGIGVVVAVIWWVRWWWVVGRKTFRTRDTAATVLLRIARRDRLLRRRPVTVDSARRYVLQDGDDRAMLGQPMVCMIPAADGDSFVAAVDENDFRTVTGRIRLHRWEVWKHDPVTVRWADPGRPGVVDVATTALAGSGPPEPMLMLAPDLPEMAAP